MQYIEVDHRRFFTRNSRKALARCGTYITDIFGEVAIGYRKPLRGAGTWLMIVDNKTTMIARADDKETADNTTILSWRQISSRALDSVA